ncbi:MAG: YtfJ family protein [Alistipes sp.]|nr:YtfJ family protein [Alistipes senegalensis]MCM1250394.1 YtfJ family protein [Alistipes sp.]
MKMKFAAMLVFLFAFSASAAVAQNTPRKVSNVELLDLDGNPTTLPHWGEKNLMIFYIDPDRHKQNEEFVNDMEENHRAAGDNLYGFGVMNLKDAPMVPNGMARSMAKKRTAQNGASVLADQDRILSTAWGLGDCNNQFVLLIVSKEGELVFVRKGILSEADKAAFYETVEKYK